MTLIVACGLQREARVIAAATPSAIIVAGGGDEARLARQLHDAARSLPAIILSSGLAGALDPLLRPGEIVLDGDARLVAWLHAVLPAARVGRIAGGDTIVATGIAKRALAAAAGAIAVDMESHVAAGFARGGGLPFAALRTISDLAGDDLPPAALVGMRPDGAIALGPVLRSLLARPTQLPALIRTASHAAAAFRALRSSHDALARAGIGRLDPREFALDMG